MGALLLVVGLLTGCGSQQQQQQTGQSPYTGTTTGTATTTSGPVSTPNQTVIQADPAWFGCRVDSDCQVERGVCNELQGVNHSYVDAFRDYRLKMSQSMQCEDEKLRMTSPGSVQCVEHRCVVPVGQRGNPRAMQR